MLKEQRTAGLIHDTPMLKEHVLKEVTDHFLNSKDFNGLPLDDIAEDGEEVRVLIRALLLQEKVVLNFGDRHPNPHILAFDPESQSEQLEKLNKLVFEPAIFESWGLIKIRTNSTQCCVYPSKTHLNTFVNKVHYLGRPHSLLLALGEPQLAYRAFNLRVLEFYRNDPRYSYRTDDIRGHISARSGAIENMADDIFLETFGFAFEKNLSSRYVAVFLRYISRLTPEHQQRWMLEQVNRDTFLHPDYAKSSLGDWSAQESVFSAFCEELKIINEMSAKIAGTSLFRDSYSSHAKPDGFSFLIRPTKKEYGSFIQLLDKMLSDNLNKKFFEGQVDMTVQEERNGKVVERPKGTIALLADWLIARVKLKDNSPRDRMINTFKKVRGARSPLAHSIEVDEWDDSYFGKQRDLIIEAYGAVRTLRLILANHPSCRSVQVPDWLFRAEIRPY